MREARGTYSGSSGDERAVRDERLPRALEMVLAFGGGGVEEKRRRLDRVALGRLPQRALGQLGLSRLQQRASVQRQDVAGRARRRGGALEGVERFAERIGPPRIAPRDVEPHLAERAVDERLVRRALERAAERQHGEIVVAGARVREADRHLPLDVIAIERRRAPAAARARRRGGRRRRRGRPVPRARESGRATARPPSRALSAASAGWPLLRAGTGRAGSARRPADRSGGWPA